MLIYSVNIIEFPVYALSFHTDEKDQVSIILPISFIIDLYHIYSQEDDLEEEMATHSSVLAWEIPETEVLGGLLSTGSQKELDTA